MDGFLVTVSHPDKGGIRQVGVCLDDGPQNLTCYILNEARVAMRLVDDIKLIGSLEQSIVLRAHSTLDQGNQVFRLYGLICSKQERCSSTLIMRGQRRHVQHPGDRIVGEALFL